MIDVFWNIANALYKNRYKKAARLFELVSMMISSHAVSAQIRIGKGSKFYHHGLGCVVLQTTLIGCNCKIFQNVQSVIHFLVIVCWEIIWGGIVALLVIIVF